MVGLGLSAALVALLIIAVAGSFRLFGNSFWSRISLVVLVGGIATSCVLGYVKGSQSGDRAVSAAYLEQIAAAQTSYQNLVEGFAYCRSLEIQSYRIISEETTRLIAQCRENEEKAAAKSRSLKVDEKAVWNKAFWPTATEAANWTLFAALALILAIAGFAWAKGAEKPQRLEGPAASESSVAKRTGDRPKFFGLKLGLVAGSMFIIGLALIYLLFSRSWSASAGGRDSDPAASSNLGAQRPVRKSDPLTAVKVKEEKLPEVRSALPLTSWSRCEFDEPFTSLEKQFEKEGSLKMDVRSVTIPGLGTLPVQAKREVLTESGRPNQFGVTLSIPIRGTWNGLRLSRIVFYDLEEAGYRYTQLRFAESPEKLRSVLTANGVLVPPLGEWKPVDEYEMMYLGVERIPGGAALTCSYD